MPGAAGAAVSSAGARHRPLGAPAPGPGGPEVTATLGLVVPLFNEADRLRDYGKQLADFLHDLPAGSELLFVDDGSTDATVAAVEELIAAHAGRAIRLLRRPHHGKGATVAAGLQAVGGEYAGFCDVDLATPLEHFSHIVDAAVSAPVLAVGSRDLSGSTLLESEGRLRETLGRLYNRLLQLTVAPGVVDTQCGAKVAARSVWSTILPYCREEGFAWDAEVIAVARARHVPVQEVPIAWRHDERSQVRLLRDGTAMVRSLPRIVQSARRAAADADRPGGGGGGVFDAGNADLLVAADQTHWWFRGKAAFVATALRRTRTGSAEGWLVDVGAGAGGVTSMVGWDLRSTMVLEGNASMARQAARRGLLAVQGDVTALPLGDGVAAVVSVLDVIEHLDDPLPCLREARRVLAGDGRLVVNVPAHQWLWSAADEELGHIRRYTRTRLERELAAAGLDPVLVTHVFSWLVPPVWFTRRLSRQGAELGLDKTSPLIDRAAMVLTAAERALVGHARVPLGTSLLCVARPKR